MRKTALITGGFGGIGWAITEDLAHNGYDVAVLSRSAEEQKDRLLSLPGDHIAIKCDVTKTENILEAREIVKEKFGKLNVLVTCAGESQSIPHFDLNALTDEFIDDIISKNLKPVITSARTFLPILQPKDSVIVNIGSVSGQRWGGSNIVYAACKAGVDSLTRNLARALAPNTRVVCIAPGLVDTPFVKLRDDIRLISETPLKRIGQPKDVSEMVVSVINHKFLTGNVIVVDGGRGI